MVHKLNLNRLAVPRVFRIATIRVKPADENRLASWRYGFKHFDEVLDIFFDG